MDMLRRWQLATSEIDTATSAMRFTVAEQPMGMQSDEFEQARKEALAVLEKVWDQTKSPSFWPVLNDNNGARTQLEFMEELEEAHRHQLKQLNQLGIAAEAFRAGREADAPSQQEMTKSMRDFARVLDQLGALGAKLARHYNISSQEIQASWRTR